MKREEYSQARQELMLAAIMNSNYEYSGVWTPLTVWAVWTWKLEQNRTEQNKYQKLVVSLEF